MKNEKNLPFEIQLELKVKVINLNAAENVPFLKKCLPLESYTKFVQYVIIYKEGGEKDYVSKAFSRCKKEGLLPDYFSNLEKEAQAMIFGEYSYEDDIRVQRQEAFEEGAALQKAEDEKMLQTTVAQKDALLSSKDAEIQQLRAKIAQLQNN